MSVKRSYVKYFAALLMFGVNGIVASHIALTSYEIVFLRTLIGSLLLVIIFALARQKIHLLDKKKHTLCLIVSGVAMQAGCFYMRPISR